MEEFDPEMQKQLDSMAKSRRTVARFTGFAMSEMDGLAVRCPHTTWEPIRGPFSVVDDEGPMLCSSRIHGAEGDASISNMPPKPRRRLTACNIVTGRRVERLARPARSLQGRREGREAARRNLHASVSRVASTASKVRAIVRAL